MVVFVKGFAKLQAVFPAVGYASNDAERLKHVYGAVYACAIDLSAGAHEFAHGETSVVLERVEHCLPRLGVALTGVFERSFKYQLR